MSYSYCKVLAPHAPFIVEPPRCRRLKPRPPLRSRPAATATQSASTDFARVAANSFARHQAAEQVRVVNFENVHCVVGPAPRGVENDDCRDRVGLAFIAVLV